LPKTLFDKIWDAHEVAPDSCHRLHLVPRGDQPAGVRWTAAREPHRPPPPNRTASRTRRLNNVPNDGTPVAARIKDELSRVQVETLERNARSSASRSTHSPDKQGIVHVIGPELGVSPAGDDDRLPATRTTAHARRFGALAFGIGTSGGRARARDTVHGCSRTPVDADPYRGDLGYGVTART